MLVRQSEDSCHRKVVLLGDSKVGKTSILCQQLNGYQTANHHPTIGCHCNDVAILVEGRPVNMQIWDTAGQEMYRALVPVYVRGASAAIIVYDVTDMGSFASIKSWVDLVRDNVPYEVPLFIVGNKTDLSAVAVSDDEAEALAASLEAKLYKTSALTGEGVSKVFSDVALGMSQNKVVDAAVIAEEAGTTGKGCC